MPLPDPTSKYYLRNAYTGSYLAASGTYVASNSKVEDAFHQWIFLSGGSGVYNLYNVGSGKYFYIGTYNNSYGGYAGVSLSPSPYAFTISQPDANGYTQISASVYDSTYLAYQTVYIHDEGSVYVVTASYTYTNYDQLQRNQWYLDPIPNPPSYPPPVPMINKIPLAKGAYRIRSYNGNYLLAMPETTPSSPFVAQQVAGDDYQKWTVTPQTNGRYTVSNAGNSLYLAADANNLTAGATLISQSVSNGESPFQWDIQSASPGIFFFVGLRDSNLSIGFSNYEAEDLEAVALETSDNIPSQIWFFETFKLLAPAVFHGKRVLDAGTYTIELCDNNYYLKDVSGDLSTTSTSSQGTQFTVVYADASTPNFTLYYTASSRKVYLKAGDDRVEITNEKRKATEWVVITLEHDDGGDAYHICEAGSEDPRKAISSRRIADVNKLYFAIDPLAEQEVMQMWRFHDE